MVQAVIVCQNLIILSGVSMEGGVECHCRLMKILIAKDKLRNSYIYWKVGSFIDCFMAYDPLPSTEDSIDSKY